LTFNWLTFSETNCKAKRRDYLWLLDWQRKFLNSRNQTFADRPQTQRSNSVDLSTSLNRIKVSSIQICFRSLLSLSLHCVFSGVLNAFVKPCSIQWIKPLPSDLFWFFWSKLNNSESAVFCCRLEIHKIVKAWLKLPARFFHHFTHR